MVKQAELADYGPVRGTMVIRPYGCAHGRRKAARRTVVLTSERMQLCHLGEPTANAGRHVQGHGALQRLLPAAHPHVLPAEGGQPRGGLRPRAGPRHQRHASALPCEQAVQASVRSVCWRGAVLRSGKAPAHLIGRSARVRCTAVRRWLASPACMGMQCACSTLHRSSPARHHWRLALRINMLPALQLVARSWRSRWWCGRRARR